MPGVHNYKEPVTSVDDLYGRKFRGVVAMLLLIRSFIKKNSGLVK